jgi:hypothetical protein
MRIDSVKLFRGSRQMLARNLIHQMSREDFDGVIGAH